MMNFKRARTLKGGDVRRGPVVYWMSRDQRIRDNWSLLFAQDLAVRLRQPLFVVFCLVPDFLGALVRNYHFMIMGLQQIEEGLRMKNIRFSLLQGQPGVQVPLFLARHKAGCLVTDFDPLRIKKQWKDRIAGRIKIPFYDVDAHNIVPCWSASARQEYAAYTIRPKIRSALSDFFHEFPPLRKHPFGAPIIEHGTDWPAVISRLRTDNTAPEIRWLVPGEKAARKALSFFIRKKLSSYREKRNDPAHSGQSDLSPYFHFGHLSAQRAAIAVKESDAPKTAKDGFLEELIVRKELSDNFCFYNDRYDDVEGFPDWAKKTLVAHRRDSRDYLYTFDQFEEALTHDSLWNAAQKEMVIRGKMHGYLRMYWAKKILEWSRSPEEAIAVAIRLNDRYELDGRDPNGYAGIAWSIGGVHDRAWGERRVFGKIRYMSRAGCESKFDVKAYEAYVGTLAGF